MSMELVLKQAAFIAEVTGLSTAANSIATENTLSHGSEELPTCQGYVSQHERITELLSLYRDLIQKDASDLMKMGELVSKVDSELSATFTN